MGSEGLDEIPFRFMSANSAVERSRTGQRSTVCPECGAVYQGSDSCATRFAALLALDHGRREPWGSRHGQAFAAFALQHPLAYGTSLDFAWAALHRICLDGELPVHVFSPPGVRSLLKSIGMGVPPRPPRPRQRPTITIADLGEFDQETYPQCLDAWCKAALDMWGGSQVRPWRLRRE